MVAVVSAGGDVEVSAGGMTVSAGGVVVAGSVGDGVGSGTDAGGLIGKFSIGLTGPTGPIAASSPLRFLAITIQSNRPPSSWAFISRTSKPKRDFWATYNPPFRRVVAVTITLIGSVSLMALIKLSSNFILAPATAVLSRLSLDMRVAEPEAIISSRVDKTE